MLTLKDTFNKALVPVHKEGYNIILLAFIISFLFLMVSGFFGAIALICAFFCVYFFRDPKRISPDEENLIIAPADGIIDFIGKANPPAELKLPKSQKWTRVSIFLNIFNVHVQRIPISGTITQLHYRKGKFVNVAIDKYSQDNERQSCIVKTKNKIEIPFVQIAGLIARRIVCDLKKDQKVKTGEKYGIIRFGSRVDLYLPAEISPKVKIGQTMIGGETIIAKITDKPKSTRKKPIKRTTKTKKTSTKK